MTNLEKSEVTLIFVITISLLSLQSLLPSSIAVSSLILYSAALLLFQGLIRDLFILFFQKSLSNMHHNKTNNSRTTKDTLAPTKGQCFCMESTVGTTGVLVGLCLFSFGFNQTLSISGYFLAGAISVILILGFLLKDYVFGWNPWKIYKEPDHMNVIFQWKS